MENASLTNLSETDEQQLSTHVTEIYDNLAKLKHTQEELDDHLQYIKTRVIQPIIDKFNKRYPELAVDEILLNGSMSNKTKIESPCEVDFMLPMALSKHVSFDEYSAFLNEGYVLDGKLPKLPHLRYILRKSRMSGSNLFRSGGNIDALVSINSGRFSDAVLHVGIKKGLSKLHTENVLIYKGEKRLNDTPVESSHLEEKEVILDTKMNRCVRLRVWAPLCVTDIDLAFCLKMPSLTHTEDHFYVALPGYSGWVKSYYEMPYLRASRIDDHHRKVLMAIKYIVSQHVKFVNSNRKTGHRYKTSFHSHALFTITRYHQDHCDMGTDSPQTHDQVPSTHPHVSSHSSSAMGLRKESAGAFGGCSTSGRSFGKCFHDIIYRLCKLMFRSDNEHRTVEIGRRWLESLCDIDCDNLKLYKSSLHRETISSGSKISLLAMYTLYMQPGLLESLHSSDCYPKYLELMFKESYLEFLRQVILQDPDSELTSDQRKEIPSLEDKDTVGTYLNGLIQDPYIKQLTSNQERFTLFLVNKDSNYYFHYPIIIDVEKIIQKVHRVTRYSAYLSTCSHK